VIQCLYKAGVKNPESMVSTASTPGTPVTRDQLQPGDLCYKTGSGEGGHVAIYIGNGKIMEAYSQGQPPRIRDLKPNDEFNAFRRVFDQGGKPLDTANMPTSNPVSAPTGGSPSVGGDNSSVGGGGSRSSMSLPSSGGGSPSPSSGGSANAPAGTAPNANPSSQPSGPPPSSMPAGNLQQWIDEAIKILEEMGVPKDKIDRKAIEMIIQHESSGNPNAINLTDSNAAAGHPSKGLMQTIDSTFNSFAAPGHNDVWNPVDNIVAGVRYALNRYGSLAEVPGVAAVNSGGSYRGY
jgi:hypothetical protein